MKIKLTKDEQKLLDSWEKCVKDNLKEGASEKEKHRVQQLCERIIFFD